MTRFFPEVERNVKDDIKDYLDELGCWWFMPVNRNRKGVPDFIVCYRGFFLAIETKRKKKGRVTGLQELELGRIKNCRGLAIICDDIVQLEEYMTYVDKLADVLYGSTHIHVARSDEKPVDLRPQGRGDPGGAGGKAAAQRLRSGT